MRRLLLLLFVVFLAGSGGCGGAAATGATERFTQTGVSMEPTVKVGQVITVRTIGPEYALQRGDIVLFRDAGGQWADTTTPFLKRVIAVGGETIACCDVAGRVTVDGAPLDEPYVADNAPLDLPPTSAACGPRQFATVAVPEGTVFVMGDNRAKSNDSRCAGPIQRNSIFAIMIG